MLQRLRPMTIHRSLAPFACALALVSATGCGGAPARAPEPDPGVHRVFSGERAARAVAALREGDPRAAIVASLEAEGVPVEAVETHVTLPDTEPITLTHLVASLEGASADRIVLVAAYDARPAGVDPAEAVSGAAVLLELARVLAEGERPYTTDLVWLDGESIPLKDGSAILRWLGSESLARLWESEERTGDIRLLVAIDRVCADDLVVARDANSHRRSRNAFWDAARRLRRSDTFDPTTGFSDVVASHTAFRERGVVAVVGLQGLASTSTDAPPEEPVSSCSAASLATVGEVVLAGLDRLAALYEKTDRFAR